MQAIRAAIERGKFLDPKLEAVNVIDAKGVVAAFVKASPGRDQSEDYEYSVLLFRMDGEDELHYGGRFFADTFDAAAYTYKHDGGIRAFCDDNDITVGELEWLTQAAPDPDSGDIVNRK